MTGMIIVTLRMTVQPGKRHDFAETIRGMLKPTRVERGCISYCLYEDIENKNIFVLVEEWKTRDDLKKHVRTDNYRRLLALMDLLSEPPRVAVQHRVTNSRDGTLINGSYLEPDANRNSADQQ